MPSLPCESTGLLLRLLDIVWVPLLGKCGMTKLLSNKGVRDWRCLKDGGSDPARGRRFFVGLIGDKFGASESELLPVARSRGVLLSLGILKCQKYQVNIVRKYEKLNR